MLVHPVTHIHKPQSWTTGTQTHTYTHLPVMFRKWSDPPSCGARGVMAKERVMSMEPQGHWHIDSHQNRKCWAIVLTSVSRQAFASSLAAEAKGHGIEGTFRSMHKQQRPKSALSSRGGQCCSHTQPPHHSQNGNAVQGHGVLCTGPSAAIVHICAQAGCRSGCHDSGQDSITDAGSDAQLTGRAYVCKPWDFGGMCVQYACRHVSIYTGPKRSPTTSYKHWNCSLT